MPLFTKTIVGGIAALLSIPVFGVGVIAANYSSSILTHLVDIVNGPNTTTAVSTNAPSWEVAIPILSPVINSVATSSSGTLASSTPYIFEVAALDGTGTTTLTNSQTITTNPSGSGPAEAINITWNNVNGATGYAIYFGTSTTIGSGLTQYFLATTSNQYTFATSTGSLSGSYTNSDTTAFSEVLNPNGTDVFNDNVTSVGTSTVAASTTAQEVNGTVVITAPATTTACEADTAGAVFFNQANKHEWGCNGTTWTKIF